MAPITDEKVRGFLEHGTRTGKIDYGATDGRPSTAPVWFLFEGDEIVSTTGRATAEGVSTRRDPRLAMCVDPEEQPCAFVQVRGEAMASENPDELLRVTTVIAARCVGTERAEEFGRRNGVAGEILVRLRPTRVVAEFDITA